MQKTLKELDKVLAYVLEGHKKGLEVYYEEIVELFQPDESQAHINDVIDKLLELGYIVKSDDTNNFAATLDGEMFLETSKNARPFSDKMRVKLGDKDSPVLINNQTSVFFKISLSVFFIAAVAISFFIYSHKIKIDTLEKDLLVKDSLIRGLIITNENLKQEVENHFDKNDKSLNWHTIQIREIKKQLKNKEEL